MVMVSNTPLLLDFGTDSKRFKRSFSHVALTAILSLHGASFDFGVMQLSESSEERISNMCN